MDPSSCWSAMLNSIKTRFSVQNSDGIFSLVGGFALHLTLGTLYCFGNLNTYITSYIRIHVHEGIMYSDMIWIPTLATIAQVLFGYKSYVPRSSNILHRKSTIYCINCFLFFGRDPL